MANHKKIREMYFERYYPLAVSLGKKRYKKVEYIEGSDVRDMITFALGKLWEVTDKINVKMPPKMITNYIKTSIIRALVKEFPGVDKNKEHFTYLEDMSSYAKTYENSNSSLELRMLISAAELDAEESEIISKLLDGHSVTSIGTMNGWSRTKAYGIRNRAIEKIKALLQEDSLDGTLNSTLQV